MWRSYVGISYVNSGITTRLVLFFMFSERIVLYDVGEFIQSLVLLLMFDFEKDFISVGPI